MATMMLDALSKPPDLATLPEAEQQVLNKALAKEPEKRYANCREFLRALLQTLPSDIYQPVPESGNSRAGGSSSRQSTQETPQEFASAGVTDPMATRQGQAAVKQQPKTDFLTVGGAAPARSKSFKDTEPV